MSATGSSTNEFDATKAVVEAVKGLDKLKQEQVLRWAAESLGINASHPPAGPPSVTGHAAIGGTHAGGGTHTAATGGPQNIRDFVRDKNPKSDNQFAAVVAYWYRFVAPERQRQEAISAEVLQEATRMAGRDRLKKPVATLGNATSMGYLDRATERGQFRINAVGENLVAMTLPGAPGGSEKRNKKRGKKAAVKKSKGR